MQPITSGSSSYIGLVQTAVKRNTIQQVADAKQSDTPIDKEEIKQSNQEIKDKSVQAGLAVYENQIKKQTVDTYTQSTESAKNAYSTDSTNSSESEINSFDAQAVNEARSTVHKRAIGISVYEQVQSTKDDKQHF